MVHDYRTEERFRGIKSPVSNTGRHLGLHESKSESAEAIQTYQRNYASAVNTSVVINSLCHAEYQSNSE